MAESERIACKSCGKWMFHLAKTCPHCGVAQGPVAPVASPVAVKKLELKLSAEEAKALLSAAPTAGAGRASFGDVVAELVLPRRGAVDQVLTVLAGPVTVMTVMVLGYLLLREKRNRREDQLQGLRLVAVPACTGLVCALLYRSGVPDVAWGLLGASFLAWVVREVLRAGQRKDPLL